MKKKFLASLIFLLAGSFCLFSQEIIGDGVARYNGNTKTTSLYEEYISFKKSAEHLFEGMGRVLDLNGKLQKTYQHIISKALGEYDLEVGDIYSVSFSTFNGFLSSHHVTLEITAIHSDGSFTYSWYGFSYLFLRPN